jgi:hypothetical protein
VQTGDSHMNITIIVMEVAVLATLVGSFVASSTGMI